jgi:hypothetical protein
MLKGPSRRSRSELQAGPNRVINLTGLSVPPALVRPRRWDDRTGTGGPNLAVMHKTAFFNDVVGCSPRH